MPESYTDRHNVLPIGDFAFAINVAALRHHGAVGFQAHSVVITRNAILKGQKSFTYRRQFFLLFNKSLFPVYFFLMLSFLNYCNITAQLIFQFLAAEAKSLLIVFAAVKDILAVGKS